MYVRTYVNTFEEPNYLIVQWASILHALSVRVVKVGLLLFPKTSNRRWTVIDFLWINALIIR